MGDVGDVGVEPQEARVEAKMAEMSRVVSGRRTAARPRPYVSVSGVMTREEVLLASTLFRAALTEVLPEGALSPVDLAVGALVSDKTLRGEANRYPLRYPRREDVSRIFDGVYREHGVPTARPMDGLCACGRASTSESGWCGVPCAFSPARGERVLNLVHVSTDATEGFALAEAIHAGVRWAAVRQKRVGDTLLVLGCDGVQINAVWPDADVIRLACGEYEPGQYQPEPTTCDTSAFRVVLQVGPRALDAVGWDVEEVIRRVRPHAEGGCVTDLLLDWSGGAGKSLSRPVEEPVDPRRWIASSVARIGEAFPLLGVGVAGGVSGENVVDLAEVLGPRGGGPRGVSVDAESRLRDDAEGGGRLRPEELARYLTEAVRVVSGGRP